jgi:ClpP class serine protease
MSAAPQTSTATPDPVPYRLVASDVTPEGLVEILAQNRGRLALLSDDPRVDPRAYEPRGRGPLAIEPSAFGWFFDAFEPPAVAKRDDVAIVAVRGPLMQHEDLFFDSYESVKKRVVEAVAGKPKAVLLSIASPGGLVSGCFETADEIRELCAGAGVPLYAYVDGQATSAAYALACAASRIWTPEAGMLGSIGVIEALCDAREASARWGVKYALVKSGARKADGNPDAGIDDDVLAASQKRVDTLAGIFFAKVESARGVDAAKVRALEAGVVHGREAVAIGLADEVATFERVLAMVASGEVTDMSIKAGQDYEDAVAKLRKAAEGDDDDAAKAKKMLAALDEDDEEKPKDGDGEDAKGEDEKDDPDASASARTRGGAVVSARTAGELAATGNGLAQRVAQLEQSLENEQRSKLLAARPDIAPALAKVLATKPLAEVREILAAIEKPKAPKTAAAAQPEVAPTRGATQGTVAGASGSEPSDIDVAMGLVETKQAIRREGNSLVFGHVQIAKQERKSA